MSAQATTVIRAGEGERFTPEAFAGQLGKVLPVRIDGRESATRARVVGAEVIGDGTAALVTLELITP